MSVASSETRSGSSPLFEEEPTTTGMRMLVWGFVLGPTIIVLTILPFAWANGWGPSWLSVWVGLVLYCLSTLGISAGYHRLFTHNSYKAKPALRVFLAMCGMLAGQGPVTLWVADHRRHHAFSDRQGDPHSPWLFGTSPLALARGFWHAHMGWMLDRELTNKQRFAPDLLGDKTIQRLDRYFWLFMVISLGSPAAIGWLVTGTWQGALLNFLWAGLLRFAAMHHVTWSINSICHMIGDKPFKTRDKAANFWPLAIFSFGESWHNLHHADPTCARHGVLRWQFDISARMIWLWEKLGWVYDVRWPTPQRLERLRAEKAA